MTEMGTTIVVREGDCISSIAAAAGHVPATIWDHPENEKLRNARTDPNVLMPGDTVFVPPIRPKVVKVATGQRHRFRRVAVPEKFRLRLLDRDGAPRAGVPYRFTVDGTTVAAETDADGYLEEWIPPRAAHATIEIDGEEIELALGALDPVDCLAGVRARLVNLGYLDSGDTDAAVDAAVLAFQLREGLELTGTADDATRARLLERHGS